MRIVFVVSVVVIVLLLLLLLVISLIVVVAVVDHGSRFRGGHWVGDAVQDLQVCRSSPSALGFR